MNPANRIFRSSFLISIPAFFVLHHFFINYPIVSSAEAAFLFIYHLLFVAIVYFILFVATRDHLKAAVLSAPVILLFLSFGQMTDMIQVIIPSTLIAHCLVILFWISCIFLQIKLAKNTKLNYQRQAGFLSVLFLVWIGLEYMKTYPHFKQFNAYLNKPVFKRSNLTDKPSIFLILLDEYPGSKSLQAEFGYSNSKFENDLSQRGFFIHRDSKSNYDQTSFSMASLFSLGYLPISDGNVNNFDYNLSSLRIDRSPLWEFLNNEGYDIVNLSIFRVAGEEPLENSYWRNYTGEYMKRTLPGRLDHEYGDIFKSNRDLAFEAYKRSNKDRDYNIKRFDQLLELKSKPGRPQFIYAHFMMPHYPYYLDSNGRYVNYNDQLKKENFVPYLIYSNKRILNAIEELQRLPGKKVIWILSDHGYRTGRNIEANFKNLSAIYTSFGQISFPDRMSSVNQMRTLLNHALGQQLPMISDSSISVFR